MHFVLDKQSANSHSSRYLDREGKHRQLLSCKNFLSILSLKPIEKKVD